MHLYLKKILACLDFSLPFNYVFCLFPFLFFIHQIHFPAVFWVSELLYYMNSFTLLCSLLVSFQMECSELTIQWVLLFFSLHLVVVLCTISTFIENTSDNIITFSFSNKVHYKEFKGRTVYYVYSDIYYFCCSLFPSNSTTLIHGQSKYLIITKYF